jgi:hypothetical protein
MGIKASNAVKGFYANNSLGLVRVNRNKKTSETIMYMYKICKCKGINSKCKC